MQDIEALLARVKENEEILRRFHLLESKILSVLNLKDFFENLLTEMMVIFRLPAVWVTVIENSRLAQMIDCIAHSDIIRQRLNVIPADDFHMLFKGKKTPILINTDISLYRSLFPDGRIYPAQSIALAPVYIDGETVGSLNQADTQAARFEPGMDTSLLEQLMIKISLCLSNVMAHERLQFFAYHDPLTGLLNRRAFEYEFRREFSRAQRHRSRLSIVFTDLDAFKSINDRFGHDTGDQALQHTARTLEGLTRKEDIVSRFAGDEFMLLLPETDADRAEALMARIQAHLDAHPLRAKHAEIPVSLSYGIASERGDKLIHPDHLIKEADNYLYAVKNKKRAAKARFDDSRIYIP